MNLDQNKNNQSILLEHVNCDFCGCTKYQIRYRKPDNWLWLNQFEYPVVECTNCGLVFVNPRPTQNSMRFFYVNEYHNDRDTAIFTNRYEIESEYLHELTDEKVLDIGCARGDFLIFLKQKYPNISVYGNDFFSESVNSSEVNFCNSLLYESKYPDNFFNVITSWAVFEHLHTPSLYFQEVNRILKNGGKFIFLVTNAESLYGKKAFVEDIPRHLYHYSEISLNNYAEKFGFIVNKIEYDDRIWDGRGIGTFNFLLTSIVGVNWEIRHSNKIKNYQKIAGKIGSLIDKIVFRTHWEAKHRCSGVIIVEFTKK